jgi:uncharacterized protein (DUF488 family)
MKAKLRIYTIGHSNRALEDFIALLTAHEITVLADVRKLPGSRRYPHFNAESLQEKLPEAGIRYIHFPQLGGLRKPAPDSPNGAWRNASFQAYADYMLTESFSHELDALIELAKTDRVAIMCAEALPWQCHRSLIADALVVRGIAVSHIMSATKLDEHALRDWAHVEGTRITYPPAQQELF